MATHALDIATFRIAYPAFADPAKFPDATITAQWTVATVYLSPNDSWTLCGDTLAAALNLMLAHLLQLIGPAGGKGGTGGVVKGSTVDKVSVTLEAPPIKSQWGWWLNQTPYGAALLALLQLEGTGGFYAGGLPEQASFRRVGGRFGRGWR